MDDRHGAGRMEDTHGDEEGDDRTDTSGTTSWATIRRTRPEHAEERL